MIKPISLAGMLFLFLTVNILAQQYTISGYVQDVSSGEKLFAASVYDSHLG